MTVVLLGIAVLVCSAVTLMILRDSFTIKRIQYRQQAYFLAEAGAETAINALNDNFSWGGVNNASLPTVGGSYTVTVRNHPTVSNRKLAVSTGTFQGVSRTINLQVQNNTPTCFMYVVLNGGQQVINGNTVIYGDADNPDAVHSNSHLKHADDIYIWADAASSWPTPPTIHGIVSAQGNVNNVNGVLIPSQNNPQPNTSQVKLSPFVNSFFNWYKKNADVKLTGNPVIFNAANNPWANSDVHLVYVNGSARFDGTGDLTFAGCLVTTKDITFQGQGHTLIQNSYQLSHSVQILPAFISRSGSINCAGGGTVQINGMVYARQNYSCSFSGSGTNFTINGALYAGSKIDKLVNHTINYVRPNPPGLKVPSGVAVLSWSEQ